MCTTLLNFRTVCALRVPERDSSVRLPLRCTPLQSHFVVRSFACERRSRSSPGVHVVLLPRPGNGSRGVLARRPTRTRACVCVEGASAGGDASRVRLPTLGTLPGRLCPRGGKTWSQTSAGVDSVRVRSCNDTRAESSAFLLSGTHGQACRGAGARRGSVPEHRSRNVGVPVLRPAGTSSSRRTASCRTLRTFSPVRRPCPCFK